MSICLFERFRCEHLIEGVPVVIGVLLMLLMLILLLASLALLVVEATVAPVGLFMISAISPGLCGPIVSAIVVSSVIVILGRWVR